MLLIRTLIVATLVGLAAAANCLGAASAEPLYCQAVIPDSFGVRYCNHQAIAEGDIAPLQVAVTNNAQYTNTPVENTYYSVGATVYIPAKLVLGEIMQIVFACKDVACTDAYDDLFEYTGEFVAGKHPEDEQAVQDWKDGGRQGPRPVSRRLDNDVTFEMGMYPGDLGVCSGLPPSVNKSRACGFLTLTGEVHRRLASLSLEPFVVPARILPPVHNDARRYRFRRSRTRTPTRTKTKAAVLFWATYTCEPWASRREPCSSEATARRAFS